MSYTLFLDAAGGFAFANGSRSHRLHPIWLRERTQEPGTIDEGSRQRLYDPATLPSDLHATEISDDADGWVVRWSDGHEQNVNATRVARELGWETDPEAPPAPIAWSRSPEPFPRFPFPEVDDLDGLRAVLHAFWTHGFAILTGTPTEPGSLEQLARRFGQIRSTNFGLLFDVFTKPDPVDLAYTPIELKQHTDNPYRMPVPGIQFLHCLINDADGGESTLADGYAAFLDMAEQNPEGHAALTSIPVTYRYEFGREALASTSPLLETDIQGNFIGIRNSDRLDFVQAVEPERLEVFYQARRELRELLNDHSRRAFFKLDPGDLMMMDNRRLLHGRVAYSLTTGSRHLQGCYIDHDGPDMGWRSLALAERQRR